MKGLQEVLHKRKGIAKRNGAEVEAENWMKEGDGISQRIYMHNPWTQTIVW